MKSKIFHTSQFSTFDTEERCQVMEIANNDNDSIMSIAHIIVAPHVSTQWHELIDTSERYIITQGRGLMEIDGLTPTEVQIGDVVHIPANVAQRITNVDSQPLHLTCVCTPRFHTSCYKARYDLENA